MKGTPLERRTPLAKKRAKPRRKPAARCTYGPRCAKRVAVTLSDTERYCGRHGTWVADKLCGDFVRRRDGRCILAGFNGQPCYEADTLYWAHLFPKGTYPRGRYIALNAVAACSRHHMSFDLLIIEKDEWMREHLGDQYDWLKDAVRTAAPRTKAEVITDYRLRAAAA